MRFFLLLVLFVCILAYVRAQQPSTWNSWMVAIGANSLVSPVSSDASSAPVAPAAAAAAAQPAPPTRIVPVGGLVKNGNFVAGHGSWEGDGVDDPSGKGLVVTLSPSAWTRVYQTFPGNQLTQYSIEVTYKLSPGLTLSQNPDDYTDISHRLQISGFENFRSMGISPGNFYGTVGDPTSSSMSMEVFAPQLGTTDIQDYQHTYPPIPAMGNNTFALAFPPGTGTVTLLSAYVVSH